MKNYSDLKIEADISKAETLPAYFYNDDYLFELSKEKVFIHSWQLVADAQVIPHGERLYPFIFLEGFVHEPLILVKDKNESIYCLSNVCTHRGNILVHHPGKARNIACLYHGRQFTMDGQMKFMPEFKEAQDFPRPCDHLPSFQVKQWGPFIFTGLEPQFDFQTVIDQMKERVGFLPLDDFKLDPTLSKDYLVNSHWALYCDNYLEGFHIPFVHEDLNEALDYGKYKTEIYDKVNLQIGYSSGGEEVFDLPEGHMDYGSEIAAYYYWVYPNMMFNFYPWGCSVNIVKPLTKNKTRVSFLSYVWDESKLNAGAGALLDKVEREDEFVVEGVHQGLQSRYYKKGRFSPTREQGVHHFHSLLAAAFS